MAEASARLISKKASKSRKLPNLSPDALVLFFLLIPNLNSHGKMEGDPHYVKGKVVPRFKRMTPKKIAKYLAEISTHTNVKYFPVDGIYYIHSLNFKTHQPGLRANRMGPNLLPSYTPENIELPEHSRSHPGVVPDNSVPEVEVEVEVEQRYMSFFKKFKNEYPARNGKKLGMSEAEDVFKDLKPEEWPLVCTAAKNFAKSKQVKDGIGIPDAKRFIRKAKKVGGKHIEPWRDWIVPESAGGNNTVDALKRKQKGLEAAIKRGEAGGNDDQGNLITGKLLKQFRAELEEVEGQLREEGE